MSAGDLIVTISRSGTRYTLLHSVDFPEEFVVVPMGFKTDFASVPKWLWSIFPPTGYYQRAALLHDYCYMMSMFPNKRVCATRRAADAMFRRQMKRDGVGWRTRYTLWLAVRLFGGQFWTKP